MNLLSRSQSTGLALAVVVVVAVVVRMPAAASMRIFNVDEADYASRAAFLMAEDRSVFEYGSQLSYPVALYRAAAELCGPYDLRPLRVLWGLLVAGIAVGIFRLAQSVCGTWCGVVGASLYAVMHVPLEGYAAEREIPAAAAIMAGCLLLLKGLPARESGETDGGGAVSGTGGEGGVAQAASPATGGPVAAGRWRWLLPFSSGLCFSFALLFKPQTLPMIFVPASVYAGEMLTGGPVRRLLRAAGAHLAGFATGTILLLLPFAFQERFGTLYLNVVDFYSDYALESHRERVGGEWLRYVETFCRQVVSLRPYSTVLAVAYGVAALVFAALVRAVVRRRSVPGSPFDHPAARTALYWTVAALAAAQAGQRYAPHYFQFLLPPATMLAALVPRLLSSSDVRPLLGLGAYAAFAAFLATLHLRLPGAVLGLVVVPPVVATAVAWFLSSRRGGTEGGRMHSAGRAFRFGIDVCLAVVLVLFVVQEPQRRIGNTIMPPSKVTRRLIELARPGDRLVVWGWAPGVYYRSRILPGSWHTSAYDIVGDLGLPIERTSTNRRHLALFLDEFRAVRPRLFLEAAQISYTHSGKDLYRLARVPEVERELAADYRLVDTIDGCRIFERARDAEEPSSPAATE